MQYLVYESVQTDCSHFLHNLQTTLSSWQNFEAEREKVWRFISNTNNELHKELIFNSLDSLRTEMEHNKVCVLVSVFGIHACTVCSVYLYIFILCMFWLLVLFYRSSSPRLRTVLCERISSWRWQQIFSLVQRIKLFFYSKHSPPGKQSHNFKTTSTRSMYDCPIIIPSLQSPIKAFSFTNN